MYRALYRALYRVLYKALYKASIELRAKPLYIKLSTKPLYTELCIKLLLNFSKALYRASLKPYSVELSRNEVRRLCEVVVLTMCTTGYCTKVQRGAKGPALYILWGAKAR